MNTVSTKSIETKTKQFSVEVNDPVRSQLEAHLLECALLWCDDSSREGINDLNALYKRLLQERTYCYLAKSIDPETASVYWGADCVKIGNEQGNRTTTSATIWEI